MFTRTRSSREGHYLRFLCSVKKDGRYRGETAGQQHALHLRYSADPAEPRSWCRLRSGERRGGGGGGGGERFTHSTSVCMHVGLAT
ncbi:uncharacterized [Tachysurus ichikawai]